MLQRSHPTRHPLSLSTRSALAAMLNEHMSSSLDLFSQLKHAHWNVRGVTFQPRHELFDELAQNMLSRVDTLAERVAGLGFEVHGTARMAGENSALPDYALRSAGGQEHIRALAIRYGYLIEQMREGLKLAERYDDPVTCDIMTQALVATEHELWLLESHLEPDTSKADPQLTFEPSSDTTVETARPAAHRVPAMGEPGMA